MNTDADITIIQGDSRIVAIPVTDDDTSNDYIDPNDADAITYVVTDRRGGGTEELSLTDADTEVDVVDAENVIGTSAEKPTDLSDVPDTQAVVRVTLDPSTTNDLPDGRLYHECELEGVRNSTATVMQGEIRVNTSTT